MGKNFVFTSESVSEGHPDKIADQISDRILDAILEQDVNARVACEAFVKTGMVLVGGEITTDAFVDIESIVRQTIIEIGYTHSEMGFDGHSCAVLNAIGKQSVDISRGVSETLDHEQGAGDQGLMFGYATNETENYMPAPISYAHKLIHQQSLVRRQGILPWLRPDAKSQVSLRYVDNVPVELEAIVLSSQHTPEVTYKTVEEGIMEAIIKPSLPEAWITTNTKFYINPTGRFVIGGPMGDCGLTGRKIIVDSYGGMARHGGGAFSGKDPSKVDRSGAYMARYIAKNLVAAGIAKRLEVQISYAIGIAEPTSIYVDTFGTGILSDEKICDIINKEFDLRPKSIIDSLQLLRPIYTPTAVYGHFGRSEPTFSWEKLDKVENLTQYLS